MLGALVLTEAMDEGSVEAAEFVNDNEGITTDEYTTLDCYDDDDDDDDDDGGGGGSMDRPFESCLDMLGRISRAKALALSMVGNKAHQSTSSHVRNDTNNSFVWADLVGVVLAANEGIVRCSEVCLVSS